jgi:hypothetical protein
MKLHAQLGEMTFAVDRSTACASRSTTARRSSPPTDALARAAHRLSQVDELRKKIVATKEGGMITGEERLREFLTDLYGNVVFYEGRPSQTQIERTDALTRELADVVRDFDAWAAKELPSRENETSRASPLRRGEKVPKADEGSPSWQK